MKWLLETGFLDVFWSFGVQPLNLIAWACVFFGFLMQYLLLEKAGRPHFGVGFSLLLLAGAAVGETLSWRITGWDLLGVLAVYGIILCCALGAAAAWIVYGIRKRKKGEQAP